MALPWVSLAVSRSTTHSKSAAPLGVPEEHSLTWCVELEGVYKCNSALLALASVACVTGADQPRWPQVPAHGVVCVCVSAHTVQLCRCLVRHHLQHGGLRYRMQVVKECV